MSAHAAREPVNGWLHFAGAVLATAGLLVLALRAQRLGGARPLVGALVFGASATLMFAASALYHLRPRSHRAPLYQRLDHAMIYVFIAGSYTPVCLVALWPTLTGRALLPLVWALATLGVLLEVRARGLPRGLKTAVYLALGWVGVLTLPALARLERPALIAWLVAGGVFYSVGALFYWRKWPRGRPGAFGFHEAWHACVLAAVASHWWAVHAYVLAPR